jgi:hypothetical protein
LADVEIARIINSCVRDQRVLLYAITNLTSRLESGHPEQGLLYSQLCVGCVPLAVSGIWPALANPSFQKYASMNLCIAQSPLAARTRLPAFRAPSSGGLDDQAIIDLVAYLRTMGHRQGKPIAEESVNQLTGSQP